MSPRATWAFLLALLSYCNLGLMAIISNMALGNAAVLLFLCCTFGLMAILAIRQGHRALRAIRGGAPVRGRWLAIAALVLAYPALGLSILFLLMPFLLIIIALRVFIFSRF